MLGAGDYLLKLLFSIINNQILFKMKNNYFSAFFNPMKSMPKNGSGVNQLKKRFGRLVWNSSQKGAYVRAIHGELK